MIIEQLYTNCLAEAAYYIESDGEAAIIDPIRETAPYLEKIKARGVKLKYVFETHFHADFVSGHIDLARQTGAKIIYGPMADTKYRVYNAKDGEEFKVGKIKIRVLHTPGHTPESSCYLLFDTDGKEYCIFTGDTLFVGDVGRPDLLDGILSKEELAGMMYDSLNNKIKKLPDHVIMYPAHGPGSSCGKNIGRETWSTIGHQKKMNYALQEMSKEKFIRLITSGLTPPPRYFFQDAMINKNGYDAFEEVMKRNMKALSVDELKKETTHGALVLDTRVPEHFEKGFIKGSLNIGLNGQYAIWVGTLVDIKKPLVIVADEGKEEESVSRLARVGYENVKGFLKGGIRTWMNLGNPVEKIESITAEEFAVRIKAGKGKVIDVRSPSEFEKGHVKGAEHFSLAVFEKEMHKLPKKEVCLLHCAGGYRSMMAASMMKAKGLNNFVNVLGGYAKIKETDVLIVQPAMA